MIDDPALPVLKDLSTETLSRLTGLPGLSLLRLRHRPGKRAILHLIGDSGEGALWAFEGDKARRIARRNPQAVLLDAGNAVFEPFPNDHRLPEIAGFLRDWPALAPRLIGAQAGPRPEMLRYRPGLSCTFRVTGTDGMHRYIKIVGDEDVARLKQDNARMCAALSRGPLRVAPALGIVPEAKAIAYAAATGRPLDMLLRDKRQGDAIETTLRALDWLNDIAGITPRIKDAEALKDTARHSRGMVNTVFPKLSELTDATLRRLEVVPPMTLCQIHGDMKLEHVFLDGARACLIDTETMAVGPSDYDRAMLVGRIVMAGQDGILPASVAASARARIEADVGAGFDWCLAVTALRLAKFHAQHPAPGAERKAADILRALA